MNNAFYDSIAAYYNDIFPLSNQKLNAISDYIKKYPNASMLDIACATGEFAFHMSSKVYSMDAFDLDPNMIKIANRNKTAQHDNLDFRVGDMLEINTMYPKSFDIITCFGNSLVHLNKSNLSDVIRQIYKALNTGGSFIGQILNYDYIYKEKIKTLPLIDNKTLRFERTYDLIDENNLFFHTKLQVKNNARVVESSIPLYPIVESELVQLLISAGFHKVKTYKNFKFDTSDGNHLPLIFIAEKSE